MKYRAMLLLLSLVWGCAGADEITENQTIRCKKFIQENPVIDTTTDEMGLVGMWQGIAGLKGCIDLWEYDKEVFLRPGQKELRVWMIRKRLTSHRLRTNFVNHDPLVQSLKTLVGLHAEIADGFMDGRVDLRIYLVVAGAASSSGRYLAEQIEAKYGKGRHVIKRPKVVPW